MLSLEWFLQGAVGGVFLILDLNFCAVYDIIRKICLDSSGRESIMKKIISLILIFAVMAVYVSCGSGIVPSDTTPENTDITTPSDTPSQTPDETPENTPEETPENTPEGTPESTPVETPEETPAETPEETPEDTPLDSGDFGIGEDEDTRGWSDFIPPM